MKEILRSTILATVLFTLVTWFCILALYTIGAKFTYGVPKTMLIALFGYCILFFVISTITEIAFWLYSKLYK